MTRQSTKPKPSALHVAFGNKRRALISFGVIVAVVASAAILFLTSWASLGWYSYARGQNQVEPIRTLVVRAIDGLGVPAPVEPKTGDVYFPQAKLYLPAADAGSTSYKYTWDSEARTLTVVDQAVLQHAVTLLYTVQTVNRLFEAIPGAQACSRGAMVTPAGETPEGWRRQGTVKAADGSVLYIFSDLACSQNEAVAARLRSLKAY